MPLAKSLNGYFDVEQVLTAARSQGRPVIYRLATVGAARHWRQRAYYYRKLLAINDTKANASILGYAPVTPWDDMLLSQVEGQETCIRITFGELRGTLESLDGQVIEAPKVLPKRANTVKEPVLADDELTNLALQLSEEIAQQ